MSAAFEAACLRCKKIVPEDASNQPADAALSRAPAAVCSEIDCRENDAQQDEDVASEVLEDVTPAQSLEEEEEEPPSPAAATAPDDKVLVAGMHVAPKKKKGRGMSSTFAILAKDKDKDKKDKKKDKTEKASNLLLAANVVRDAPSTNNGLLQDQDVFSAMYYCNILRHPVQVQKCGIARGAPLVFAAPEHIDVYPRQVCDCML
jgi:hypothetical protein